MPAGHIRWPEWLLHVLRGETQQSRINQLKHGKAVTSIDYHSFLYEKKTSFIIKSSRGVFVSQIRKESQLDKTSLLMLRCLYKCQATSHELLKAIRDGVGNLNQIWKMQG